MSPGEKLLADISPLMKEVRGRLSADASMSGITWFRVGGPAEVLFQPADEDDLALFLRNLPTEIPVTIIGVGSNLLVRDGGIVGVVIRLSAKGFGFVEAQSPTTLLVGAAISDKRFAAKALELGIGGFEFYHGIPGSIGGALRMNAGANGTETTNRVKEVIAIDRQGAKHRLSHEDMGYSYRHSEADGSLIFTSCVVEGELQEQSLIQKAMDEVQHHRETVQPVREKTGGSTFKNPDGHSSWKLIDEAGLRGYRYGGAMMSELHCNFMINADNATAYDLEKLGEIVRAKVLENSGISLQWEIKRIGRFETDRVVEGNIGKT